MKQEDVASCNNKEIQYLLPWYVNETLTTAEREAVDAHLSQCSACLADLEPLRDLRLVVEDSNEQIAYPSDIQINRLAARIEEFETKRAQQKPVARFRDWWSSLPVLSRTAIAAQAVILIVVVGVSVVLVRRVRNLAATARAEQQRADANASLLAQEKQRNIEYQGLSGPKPEGGPDIKITVVFREDVTEKTIRELLLEINGARIVSGPTSARFYVLGIVAPPGANSQKIMNDAIALLRLRRDVVQLAEPLP